MLWFGCPLVKFVLAFRNVFVRETREEKIDQGIYIYLYRNIYARIFCWKFWGSDDFKWSDRLLIELKEDNTERTKKHRSLCYYYLVDDDSARYINIYIFVFVYVCVLSTRSTRELLPLPLSLKSNWSYFIVKFFSCCWSVFSNGFCALVRIMAPEKSG